MEAILIHVNRENFQQVMKEVGTLPINTEERLKGIIDMIYQKAISDPDNSEVYANMCRSQMGVSLLFWQYVSACVPILYFNHLSLFLSSSVSHPA